MLDFGSPELNPSDNPSSREGPGALHTFVARHRPFVILMAVLVAQLLLLSIQITRGNRLRLIQVWVVAVFDPFERVAHQMMDATTRAWETYRDLWRAHQQNQELQVQLVAARSRIHQLAEEAAEARRLRELLEFRERLPLPTVAAEVIASSPGERSRAVFIDKGSNAGLTPDLAVITPQGIVGKTIAVFPYSAQVQLITDTSSGAGCFLQGSRAQGVLKGGSRNLCEIHYIMNEESVAVGELALTSGLDQIYPKGLPIGSVARIEEGHIYKEIAVKPSAALDRLETVLVILKSAPPGLQALYGPSSR